MTGIGMERDGREGMGERTNSPDSKQLQLGVFSKEGGVVSDGRADVGKECVHTDTQTHACMYPQGTFICIILFGHNNLGGRYYCYPQFLHDETDLAQ